MTGRKTLEKNFQLKLITELESLFDGCFVLNLDPLTYIIQGLPDLLILYKNKWAMLESKRYTNARRQPNQRYYVNLFDNMSFCRFIYPENKEEVLHELEQAFRS